MINLTYGEGKLKLIYLKLKQEVSNNISSRWYVYSMII
jgi:hypothetical protein